MTFSEKYLLWVHHGHKERAIGKGDMDNTGSDVRPQARSCILEQIMQPEFRTGREKNGWKDFREGDLRCEVSRREKRTWTETHAIRRSRWDKQCAKARTWQKGQCMNRTVRRATWLEQITWSEESQLVKWVCVLVSSGHIISLASPPIWSFGWDLTPLQDSL